MKKIFITGTDTGIGKTIISGLLAKYISSKNYSNLYIKPIQTGYPEDDDAKTIKNISPHTETETILKFRYPSSPHLAAKLENKTIIYSALLKNIDTIFKTTNYDYYLLETAGGLFVPIEIPKFYFNYPYNRIEFKEIKYMYNIIVDTNPDLIYLVTRPSLGTINHTLFSMDFLLKFFNEDKIIIVINFYENLKNSLVIQDNINLFKNFFKNVLVNRYYSKEEIKKVGDIEWKI